MWALSGSNILGSHSVKSPFDEKPCGQGGFCKVAGLLGFVGHGFIEFKVSRFKVIQHLQQLSQVF